LSICRSIFRHIRDYQDDRSLLDKALMELTDRNPGRIGVIPILEEPLRCKVLHHQLAAQSIKGLMHLSFRFRLSIGNGN
jgi:hypothetical protein